MPNAKISEYNDTNYTPFLGMHHGIRKENERFYGFWSGSINTREGIVRWDMNKQNVSGDSCLFLEFIYKNRMYRRSWKAWYGLKTITQLANQFVQDVVGENV